MCRNFLFSIAVFVLSFSQANASDGVFGQGPSDPNGTAAWGTVTYVMLR